MIYLIPLSCSHYLKVGSKPEDIIAALSPKELSGFLFLTKDRQKKWVKDVLMQREYSRLKTGKLFKVVPGDGPITLD